VDAAASIAVYVSVTGDWDGAPFRWESPSIQLAVNEAVAQVTGLVAMGPPYPPAKEPVRMEAVVRAFGGVENLRLELWADTPGGALDRLAKINTGELNAGDERRYITAFTRGEKGTHAIYAYLYDGEERIDRRLEHIYVS
jgi:hypothetical protein